MKINWFIYQVKPMDRISGYGQQHRYANSGSLLPEQWLLRPQKPVYRSTDNDYAYTAIPINKKDHKETKLIVKNAAAGTPEEVVEEKRINTSSVYLRVNVNDPDAKCYFSYSEDSDIFNS